MYSPLRHLDSLFSKRRPVQFTFFLTRRCNAFCPYCFYLQNTDSAAIDDKELSLAEIQRFAPSLGTLLWLAFSGGEIFLRKDLVEISRVFYQHNKPAIMLFPTNGSMPSRITAYMEQILQQCPNSTIVVKLSIDELGEAHDQLRHTPRSFGQTLETYRRLATLQKRYANFELGVNTVFSAANQDRMDDIIEFVATLPGIRTHTVSLVRGNLIQDQYQQVDYGKYLAAANRLAENMKTSDASYYHFRGARLKAAQDILQRNLIHATLQQNKRQIPCYAGQINLVMDVDGEIYPCEMLRNSLGNIRQSDYDFIRLLKSDQRQNGVRAVRQGTCFCTHECHMMTNILFNPRLYPRLLAEYISLGQNPQPQPSPLMDARCR